MNIDEINSANKLIAKFMNYDSVDCHSCKYVRDCNWFQCGLTEEEKVDLLKYHSSWDWLMPVVEKIEKLGTSRIMNRPILSYFDINHAHIKLSWSKDNKYQLFLEVLPEWAAGHNPGTHKEYKIIGVPAYSTRKGALYIAVVEFIKWYNTSIL